MFPESLSLYMAELWQFMMSGEALAPYTFYIVTLLANSQSSKYFPLGFALDIKQPNYSVTLTMASLASQSRKELLSKVHKLVPPMLESFHKGPLPTPFSRYTHILILSPGQLGRVAVIGGSEDYTGAPYFSAMASARLGCDMVNWRLS